MTPGANSLTVLRVVLGAVLAVLSAVTLLHPGVYPHAAHLDLLVRGLALAEIAGAFLLLVPRTIRIGAVVLLAVFAVAVAIHFLHGEWNVGHLLIDGAAAQVFLRHETIGARG